MLEQFTPQRVDKPTPRAASRTKQVVSWKPGEELPWQRLPAPEPTPRKNRMVERVWRHEVFLGVYEIAAIYDTLHQLFADDEDAYDARRTGHSAAAYVLVDADGKLQSGSQVLSAALWGVGRVRSPGPADPQCLVGFDVAERAFEDAIDRLQAERRDAAGTEEPPPLDGRAMQKLITAGLRAAGVVDLPGVATGIIRVRSHVVDRNDDNETADFLNSFVLDDLDLVHREILRGNVGPALVQYVRAEEHANGRVDVRQQPHEVDQVLAPHLIPGGRWPENPAYHLARSQQFAVNRAVSQLQGHRGLMSVNGPPGTGKTTMLRDVLAGLVVERARKIAQLDDPADVFSGEKHQWQDLTGHQRTIHELRPEFTGYEMVVASANNTAVENVSRELPAAQALEKDRREHADYFGDLATTILRGYRGERRDNDASDVAEESEPDQPSREEPDRAWGLIAARLGRKKYRQEFTGTFWFGDKPSNTMGMQDRLKEWKKGTAPVTPWREARAAFRTADRKVTALLTERREAEERMRALPKKREHYASVQDRERGQEDRCRVAGARTNELATAARDAELARDGMSERCQRHLDVKPGFFADLMSWWQEGKAWRAEHTGLLRALEATESNFAEAAKRSQQARDTQAQEETVLEDLHEHRRLLAARLARFEERYARDLTSLKSAHPRTHDGPDELRAPWLDEELDRARSDLFLAALDLHRDLLANVPDQFLHSLRAAREVIAGGVPPDLEAEKIRAAWQNFFMVVPLVSTTFASVPRMLGKMGRESLGWLFVDEAGQAEPQLAAGALWRFERALIVGDPLQLEPITSIPAKLALDIAHTHGVQEQWLAPIGSVQTLADRSSRYGTTIDSGPHSTWVASPLQVHRRCDDPMFTLSNQIAYDGLMINAVNRHQDGEGTDIFLPGRADGAPVTDSFWSDHPATDNGGHVQPGDISAFIQALDHLRSQGISDEDIIAISPFRGVANKLKQLTKDRPHLLVGTIHVAQGREADVVILVLGGAPDRPGAKQWATAGPNLFNVAVSRAKRRLYVIGDYTRWSGFPHVGLVAKMLGKRP